jgi:alpha-glucuronidase
MHWREINNVRFGHLQSLLKIQVAEAEWWRDACLLYLQQYAKQPLPDGVEAPEKDVAYYMGFRRFFVPGI